jgi:glycerol-3-phosphate acyltransferase PlsY
MEGRCWKHKNIPDSSGRSKETEPFLNFFRHFLIFLSALLQDVLETRIEPSLFLAAAVLGYVLGSIPTAYLAVRLQAKKDIRELGSGNVGTLNSLQVTGSKLVGVLVLLGDFLKGFLAAVLAGSFFNGDFGMMATAGVSSVAGHNFPVWLGFRGGRGLATAAGVNSLLCPLSLPVWGVMWAVGFAATRKVNVANALASSIFLLLFVILPGATLAMLAPGQTDQGVFRMFGIALFLIILSKHIQPLRTYFRERNPS